ncbi:hypothetical protein GR138_03785 [Shinella kummerowiae]|uniref:Uncharacterized protein n=1 Tax=Shinella kummerowiae TaxID=417745 RepID=A0A6N8S7C2_9HYPH|nr:hypothetical protein [Shinella kummerowiae]MXN44297.1 hypothetical protein [Shinella kummerowiae]
MVAGMVEQFRSLQLRLADTLEHYETPEFKALDGKIANVFEAIYRHEPQDAMEARVIVDLFLDIIENNDAGDNIHLIGRVRTIIDDCANRCPPAMEIIHGAGI